QPDGKILIGGRFTSYDGTTRNRIARLNTDGSLDTSFNPGSGADDNIYALVLQPDGKIMIGGNFTSYDGTARNRIARLNANGSLDTSFDPGSGANSTVQTIMLQPDGKILFGGSFSRYDEMARMRFARLNANGSLDTSFDPGNGANNTVYSIAVQPDGKILIGGAFTSYDDKTRNRIARINP
ncbi:delta-60 repeat domain-containing protein, partial [Oceanibaculum indicum]